MKRYTGQKWWAPHWERQKLFLKNVNGPLVQWVVIALWVSLRYQQTDINLCTLIRLELRQAVEEVPFLCEWNLRRRTFSRVCHRRLDYLQAALLAETPNPNGCSRQKRDMDLTHTRRQWLISDHLPKSKPCYMTLLWNYSGNSSSS